LHRREKVTDDTAKQLDSGLKLFIGVLIVLSAIYIIGMCL